MKDQLISGSVGTALSAVGTALQTEQTLRIIALIITILGAILTYIVMPLLSWYKKAKKDGKIDADEMKEGIDILTNGAEDVKDVVDQVNEDKKEGK